MQPSPRFSEFIYERPNRSELTSTSAALLAKWDATTNAEEQADVIRSWDRARVEVSTLRSLAHVAFTQDTTNPESKAEKEFFDDIGPLLKEQTLTFLERVTSSPHRPRLEEFFGHQAFALWDCFLGTFDPRIADHKRSEAKMVTEYVALQASQAIPFRGKEYTFSQLRAFYGDSDRATRLEAMQARDAAMQTSRSVLDRLYGDLVQVRHEMATALGYDNFIPLAYAQMDRTDYDAEDVSQFRRQVREVVVPLATRIYERRARSLGYEDFGWHDESVRDHRGVPKPLGDHDWMLERATTLFDTLGNEFGAFFRMMKGRDLLDLKSRTGKAGGGYCTSFGTYRVPFIFANFNGTQDDVNVFTHECGHAFQAWSSRNQPLSDYNWPTIEAAEIHSMSLEFLCYPQMEEFFGEDAERYRMGHLESAILFLPYGAAVDEFQHRIYEKPDMTAEERAAVWSGLESIYLPHRRYEGMEHSGSGRMWQNQRHIYARPFYYIDYCLAQTCALQMWKSSVDDFEESLRRYRALCNLGGSLPFTGLLAKTGLKNPFESGCLASVCGAVEDSLGL